MPSAASRGVALPGPVPPGAPAPGGAALVAGDAAVTAHYRLGAGVNHAVEASLATLAGLLAGASVEAAAEAANARADALVQAGIAGAQVFGVAITDAGVLPGQE